MSNYKTKLYFLTLKKSLRRIRDIHIIWLFRCFLLIHMFSFLRLALLLLWIETLFFLIVVPIHFRPRPRTLLPIPLLLFIPLPVPTARSTPLSSWLRWRSPPLATPRPRPPLLLRFTILRSRSRPVSTAWTRVFLLQFIVLLCTFLINSGLLGFWLFFLLGTIALFLLWFPVARSATYFFWSEKEINEFRTSQKK